MKERRAYTRVRSNLPASIHHDAAGSKGVIRDLTLAGAFVSTDHTPRPGEDLRVELEEVEIEARVVRVAAPNEPRGFGVLFLAMKPEVRRAIANHILSRLLVPIEPEG